jgi:hypothetical protein
VLDCSWLVFILIEVDLRDTLVLIIVVMRLGVEMLLLVLGLMEVVMVWDGDSLILFF